MPGTAVRSSSSTSMYPCASTRTPARSRPRSMVLGWRPVATSTWEQCYGSVGTTLGLHRDPFAVPAHRDAFGRELYIDAFSYEDVLQGGGVRNLSRHQLRSSLQHGHA